MFSFSKSSYESKLMGLLQDKFFKTARRNKILAQWAGGRLGHSGATLNGYVRSTILSYLVCPDDEKMVARLLKDFQRRGVHMTEDTIRQKMQAIETRIRNKSELRDVY
ncbi:MAG: DUF1476 domain-containing protein [Holosporaceae bacterium]|jgi:hypothetical protein|nr:DUF1476 domain-containing protein [Holosporaceae bacterium]